MNAKPWYQSATYYALAVAIVTKILMMAGLAENDAGKQAGEVVTALLPFVGIVADLVAAWGRKRAQGPLTVTKAGAEAQNGQAGFARPLVLVLLAAIASLALLSGCATGGGSSATEKLIVQAATMKFIESSDDRAAKASRIVKAATQARVWLDTDGVTVADLQAAMIERIAAADLEPSDKLLASALVEVVVAELNVRIGEGVISADKHATVNAVLAWVEQAASFYAG